MARYYEETALIEFVKQYTPTIEGETTLECVERAIRNAPTADVVPKSEVEALQGALKAEERHNELTMQMAQKALANAKKEIANVLCDLKIAVHNKALYRDAKEVPSYVYLKVFDAIIKDYLNKLEKR